MELNKKEVEIERIKQKAEFYYHEKLESHVVKNPKGFVNGFFKSELIKDFYYLFEDRRFPGEENWIKISIIDIFDINDYQEEK